MNLRQQAASGALWSTLERASVQGISFVVVFLLARILGPAEYGLVTLASTIVLLGQMLLGETFSEALIQAKTIEQPQASSLFFVLLIAGIVSGALLLAIAHPIALIFHQQGVEPLLRALSPLLLMAALQAVPAALFKREFAFRELALASTSGTVAGGVAGIGLAFSGAGAWSIVANLLVQNSVIVITIWRRSTFRPQLPDKIDISALWVYGQYTFFLRVAAFIANQGPRLLIGYFFGSAALGAFSLALRIIEISWQLLVIPAVNICVPMVAKLRDEKKRLERALIASTQLVAAVVVPFFAGLAVVAPLLVPLAFGSRWAAAVPIVQILSGYGVVGALALVWGGIIRGFGRPDIALWTTCLAAATGVGAMLFTARWGPAAASLAFVVRGCVTLPFQPLLLSRFTGISVRRQYQALVPILAATTIMAIVVYAVLVFGRSFSPSLLLGTSAAIGMTVYVAAIFILGKEVLSTGAALIGDLWISRRSL